MLTYDEKTVGQVKSCEAVIQERLERWTREQEQRPEAIILVYALARKMRELLNKYPEQQRAMIVDQVIFPFLQNEQVPGAQDGKIITLQ